MHIFPTIETTSLSPPPISGSLFTTPWFCRNRADRSKCAAFYKSIGGSEGIHTCPYGFSASVHGHETIIFTGLRIEGHFDRKALKHRIRDDLIPPLTEDEYSKFVQYSKSQQQLSLRSSKALADLQEANSFMNETFHEIRKLNRDMKSQAEELNINLDRLLTDNNTEFLKYRVQNVYASSSLVSIRLDSYDLLSNPLGITATTPLSIAVYKKFEKVKHCLDNKCKIRKIRITFEGSSYKELPGYDIFELLPYVIFENAIKYSPPNHDIKATFDISNSNNIEVTNVGPIIDTEELPSLFLKGYRGKYAARHFPGTGVGLHFAKQVCDIHNVSIELSSDQNELFSVENVPYSNFKISLSLP